jgi:hypothetical protein
VPTIPFHAPGITYNGLHGTTSPTAAQVAADLATTKEHFSHARTYYPQYGGGAVDVGKIAKDAGLTALLGLFLFDGHPDWIAGNYDQFVKPAPARGNIAGAQEDARRASQGSPRRHHHPQGLLHHRGLQGRGTPVVARSRDREEWAELRGHDGYNTVATAALTPFRDGPLPRCTGPVFANMSEAAKELTRTMGVSGVNVVKDGKEIRAHNPHNTLVYSMTVFSPSLQASMKQVADEFNKILPEGINTSFRDVSIVEIGFAGNVVREIYRISLENGSVMDITTGREMPGMKKL